MTRVCPPSAASACACIAPISICGRDVACVGVDGRVSEARGACVHYRSCMGRRRREHKSRVSRRKRGRRQGVEDQRQTWKALSRSGGGSDMSGCVPGQLAPERRPTRFRNEHPVARQGQEAVGNQSSQGPANENKRTRSAGDGHGHSSGDEEAVGTGCVLESAHFDLWEAAEGSVRGGMRTVFRYLNRLSPGLTKPRSE